MSRRDSPDLWFDDEGGDKPPVNRAPVRDHAGTLVALVEHYAAELAHYRRVAVATDRLMVSLVEQRRSEARKREAAEARVAELERQLAGKTG